LDTWNNIDAARSGFKRQAPGAHAQSQKNSTVDVAFDSSSRSTATNLPFPRYKKGTWQLGFAHLETMFAVLVEVLAKKSPTSRL
jgi:hypothetical protein